jgi:hypothetical protein
VSEGQVVETMKRMAAVVDRQSLFVDVERSLAWISRYRRLNTIFERTEGHLVAFIEIAFISILSRRRHCHGNSGAP